MTIKMYINKREINVVSNIKKVYEKHEYLILVIAAYIVLMGTPWIIGEFI